MKRIFVLIIAIVLLAGALYAAPVTVEKLMSLRYAWTFDPAPDGQSFVYTVRTPDFEKSRWLYQTWLFRRGDAAARRLTYSDAPEYAPKFSRDGQWIFFLSKRKNQDAPAVTQLWGLPTDGGEAELFTRQKTAVELYQVSPDGQFIYLLCDEVPGKEAEAREKRKEKLKFDAVVRDSIKTNKVLWQLNLADRSTKRVAVLDPGADQLTVAHNGRWVVYQTNYSGSYNDEQKYDLWAVELTTGKKYQITDFAGPETNPRFSPDDRWLAYINQTTPDVEFAETDLARIRFAPGAAAPDTATLTRDFNWSVTDFRWEGDGRSFLLQVAQGTETPLYRFRADRRKNRYRRLALEAGNVLDFHRTKSGELICLWENSTHLPEFVSYRSGKSRILSRYSDQLAGLDLGTQKLYHWKSVDGKEIEGLLFLPSGFDPHRKYPLVLTVHGGPYGRFRQAVRQAYYTQVYTSAGYVVLAPNPRGSSGYDDAFGKAIWYKAGGHMGGIDYQDIMAGVDALIKDGVVDETHMGVIGGSYGGYLTNWIISQNNRFAAAVSQFGIFSLFTDWSNSWQPNWEKMYLGIYYWEKPIGPDHPYVKYSPAFYVTNIHTPVLILHGTQDRYTNLANSQEMYQALKTLKRPVKFVVYPREGHGLGREPNHRRDVVHRSQKWFDRYLKPSGNGPGK